MFLNHDDHHTDAASGERQPLAAGEQAGAAQPRSSRVSRRRFVSAVAAGVGALVVGGVPTVAKNADGGRTAIRNALRIPATVSPVGLTLTAAAGSADLGGGQTSTAWMYNGQFPGPTIIANSGDSATITLHNQLAQETITHWHGLIVPEKADGHPRYAVAPASSYVYPSFAISQRAGLNWYHPHPHMLTGEQVYYGLAGAFIVRDTVEAGLGLPSAPYEVPLIIRDASFDSRGNLKFGAKSSGFLGNTPLVNGTRDPFLAVDQAVYRFRVLNGSNARVLRLALSSGAQFVLIGNDGGLLPAATSLGEITLGPAERLDLLVDFRELATGASVMLRCLSAGWDLIEFRGTGVSAGGTIPTGPLSTIAPLSAPAVTREFSFDGMSRINGKLYDITRIDFQVPQGQVERWIFRTNGNAPHPVHVHGASFQVQRRSGGRARLFPWEQGWKDTVLLEDGETVEVLIRFDTTPGIYLIHCHQLAHEDHGMMSNFEVVSPL